jgi:putative membrane protein
MRYGARALLVAASAAALGACKGRDEVATTDTATGMVSARSDTGAAMSRHSWTDAEIVAFTNAANSGEIQEGTVAERKATNPEVKAYARQMVADHKKMMAEGKALASKNNIQPDSTTNEVRDFVKDGQDELKELSEKQAGKDWDEEYMEHQVDAHKKVLDKLREAEQAATNPELKTMLTKAAAKVQEHLTKAEQIKDKVG